MKPLIWLLSGAAVLAVVGVVDFRRFLPQPAGDPTADKPQLYERYRERVLSHESDEFDDTIARRNRTVAALLDRATLAVNTDRITEPAGDNALEYYKNVLELDPGNSVAETGIRDIVDTLVKVAGRAAAREDFPTAQSLLAQAIELKPGSVHLELTRRELDEQVLVWNTNRTLREKIEVDLKAANAALAAGRLSSPSGDNALEIYRSVLAADPGNASAAAGISKVVDALVRQANAAIDNGNPAEARSAIGIAGDIMPNAGNVKLAQQRLHEKEGPEVGYQPRFREVEALLDQADADIAALRLSSPPGNNAVMRFREVLELDPMNREARRGFEVVVERYVTLTKQALASEKRKQASVYVERAKAILPDSAAVKLLEQSLKTARVAPAARPTQRRPEARPVVQPKNELSDVERLRR